MRSFGSLLFRLSLRCAAICLMVMAIGAAWAQEGGGVRVAGGEMVRGTVTAAAADHLSIKTDTGDVYQVAVTDNTRMMKNRQPIKVAEIKPGDSVGAMGVMDAPNKTVHAAFVMVVDAAQAQKMREDLGKVYIAGRVTAMDELKLTIERPDGVSQVIAVDEGTSFRKGGRRMQAMIDGSGPVEGAAGHRGGDAGNDGESITLADIKVGDRVAGRGAVKGGIFVPSELAVTDAAAGRQRRRANGTGAAAPDAGPQ